MSQTITVAEIHAEQVNRGRAARWLVLSAVQAARPAEAWRVEMLHSHLMSMPWIGDYLRITRDGQDGAGLLVERLRDLCHHEAADAEGWAAAGDLTHPDERTTRALIVRLGLPRYSVARPAAVA